ncbi:MAG: tetratricopeptide repeat protein [Myxococcota bacterium]
MELNQYQRAYAIFMDVVQLPAGERAAAVQVACGSDADLQTWVEQLLDETNANTQSGAPSVFSDVQEMVAATLSELSPGVQIADRFEVVDQIGAGGMGEVWKVRHLRLGSFHALKVLRNHHPSLRRRFELESRLHAQVRHPNVVRVFDVIQLSSQPALVMEFIEGYDLGRFLRQRQPDLAQLDALAMGIFSGVTAVHEAGLIHRDLKPANILLQRSGDVLIPKITDFGIARHADAGVSPGLTGSGAMLGTLTYMAPEQIRDPRQVDARADIWALGCVLYRMVTGQVAFHGADNGEIILRVLSGDHKPLPPDLPERWRRAILETLQTDPARRPPSVDALRAMWSMSTDVGPLGVRFEDLTAPPPTSEDDASFVLSRLDSQLFAPPDNLPVPRDTFVGRTEDVAALRALLCEGRRLVTLWGLGGLGKSRLAIEVGTATRGRWSGGIWWVPLADVRTEGGIYAAVAQVLKLSLGQDPHKQLCEALAERGPTLFILDNFEQLNTWANQTVGRWLDEVETLQVLVTSREPLRLTGEQLYPLAQLPEDDAVQLFTERAQQASSRFSLTADNRDVVAKLVRQLDRMPLAIELAAARSRMLSPQKLLDRLGRRFEVLKSRSRDLPERQRTLRAAIAWSWGMLDEIEQSVLAQCSVFEGGMSFEAAEAVIDPGSPTVWVEEVLAELVDKSLLVSRLDPVSGEDRLSMLVSVQHFAAEQLTDRAAAERRHAEYFAEWGEEGDLPALRYVAERDNLRAACERAVLQNKDEAANLLVATMVELFRHQGPFAEGADFFEALIGRAPSPMLVVRLQRAAGIMCMLAGRTDDAERHLNAAVATLEQVTADIPERVRVRRLAQTLKIVAVFNHRQGRKALALAQYTRSIDAAQAVGADELESQVRLNLGVLYHTWGQLDDALAQYTRSVEISRRRGDLSLEGQVLTSIGILHHDQNRPEHALKAFTRSVEIARTLGKRGSIGKNLVNMGALYRESERYDDALETHTAALAIARQLDDALLETLTLTRMGMAYLGKNNLGPARDCLDAALVIAERLGDYIALFLVRGGLGELYREIRRWEDAKQMLQDALAMAEKMSRPADRARLLDALGELMRRQGQLDDALPYFTQALDIATSSLGTVQQLSARVAMAALHRERGETERVEEQLRRSAPMVADAWSPTPRIRFFTEQAQLAVLMGKPDDARRHLADARAAAAAAGQNLHFRAPQFIQQAAQALSASTA